MEDRRIITGTTDEEIWGPIQSDLSNEDVYTYNVIVNHDGREIQIFIDIDPGGGFEGGSEITQLTGKINVPGDFRFALHHEGFIDEIGKFFGMEDINTGYDDLDPHVVIKTNHKEKLNQIFQDSELRSFFAGLEGFDLGIHSRRFEGSDTEQQVLELNIDQGLTDVQELQKAYRAFYAILIGLES